MLPPRFTYVISKHGPAMIVALLVLGTVGLGAAGWVSTNPPTTEVTDHSDRQTVKSSLSTQSVVTGETSLYQEGTTIKNQPVYLRGATPNLTLALETRLPSATAGSVDQHVELVYTATRNGEEFWKRTKTLSGEQTRTERTVATRTTVAIPSVLEQRNDYQAELGEAASVAVRVRTSVEYSHGKYEGTFSETTAISSGTGWYSVPSTTESRTHSTRDARTVELGVYDKPRFLAPGILGGLFFLTGLLVAGIYYGDTRRQSAVTEVDVHHERYADWISRGTLPQNDERTAIQTRSLEDLVDVAIDTGERVIYDAERDRYAVFRGGAGYYHNPVRQESD